jgi:hypothetical protein
MDGRAIGDYAGVRVWWPFRWLLFSRHPPMASHAVQRSAPTDMHGMIVNMVADGLFDGFCWVVLIVGVVLAYKDGKAGVLPSGKAYFGWNLLGVGVQLHRGDHRSRSVTNSSHPRTSVLQVVGSWLSADSRPLVHGCWMDPCERRSAVLRTRRDLARPFRQLRLARSAGVTSFRHRSEHAGPPDVCFNPSARRINSAGHQLVRAD